jgi:ATP-dependent NAD(P)H-hydrate dehydratase
VSDGGRCILTPNQTELQRLIDAAIRYIQSKLISSSNETAFKNVKSSRYRTIIEQLHSPNHHRRLRALSIALGGVTVMSKGAVDTVSSGNHVFSFSDAPGIPRRCGGQGDILAGCIGVAFNWALSVS